MFLASVEPLFFEKAEMIVNEIFVIGVCQKFRAFLNFSEPSLATGANGSAILYECMTEA